MTQAEVDSPFRFLGDFGIASKVFDDFSAAVRTKAVPYICGADGGVRPGMLATLVDVVGGVVGVRILRPDWMATADLTLQLIRPATGPSVEALGRVVRRGRTNLVLEAEVRNVASDGARLPLGPDGKDESVVGFATMTFGVLPARPGSAPGEAISDDLPTEWEIAGAGFAGPVAEVVHLAADPHQPGRVTIPVVPYVHNSIGALQGGMLALMAEESALRLVADHDGVEYDSLVVTDLYVSYLSLARVGPAATRARLMGDDARPADGAAVPARRNVVVHIVDEGADDRLATVITVGVRRRAETEGNER